MLGKNRQLREEIIDKLEVIIGKLDELSGVKMNNDEKKNDRTLQENIIDTREDNVVVTSENTDKNKETEQSTDDTTKKEVVHSTVESKEDQDYHLSESINMFEQDKEEFDLAKIEFNKWVDYIYVLADTFQDDILFEYRELLEKESYNIHKAKKIFFIPLHKKDETQNLIKQLTNEVKSSKKVGLDEFMHAFKNASIRITGELDYTLFKSGPTKYITNYAKDFLIKVFILSLKQLEQSKKELIRLLSKTINSQKELQVELLHPSLATKKNENGNQAIVETDFWKTHNSKTIKKTLDKAKSLKETYKKYLINGLFKVYNEIRSSHINFNSEISSINDDEREFIEVWNTLFEEIQQLILAYLKDKLHICPIACSRGDAYNYIFHKPQREGEPDEELTQDSIKSVEAIGFRFMGDYEANMSVSDSIPLESEKLKSDHILLQTEVIVVLNK